MLFWIVRVVVSGVLVVVGVVVVFIGLGYGFIIDNG